MQQHLVKSFEELSVQLHSCLSLFVFLQTAIVVEQRLITVTGEESHGGMPSNHSASATL